MDVLDPSILSANSAVYGSLKGTKGTIRLLQGSRNWLTGKISWKLAHYRLDSKPCYTALSYAWGKKALSRSIQLNGRTFRVTESVFTILEAIIHNPSLSGETPWSESWWWIDFICINRCDAEDRKAQVRLMGDIYSESDLTIAWLGHKSGEIEDEGFVTRGEKAIDCLNELHRYRNAVVKGPDPKGAMAAVTALVDWGAVGELLRRPWWIRVWTLQEFLLPERLEIWCGRKFISKNNLGPALYCIYKIREESVYRNVLAEPTWLPAWNRRRLFQWQMETPNKLPLVALIAYGSDCKASKPEDRIYSVLGLAQRFRDQGLVEVSTGNASDAYIDFAINFFKKHQSLDLLCFTHIFNNKSGGSDIKEDLPSWVPDWSAKIPSYVIPVMASQTGNPNIGNFRPVKELDKKRKTKAYAASGNEPPQFEIRDKKMLVCRGIPLDQIQGIGATKSALKNRETLSPEQASSILDEISRILVVGRQDRYLTSAVPRGYYYHSFRKFCIAAIQQRYVPRLFLGWFRVNRDLITSGHSLKEICNLSKSAPRFAEDRQSIRLDKEFLERFRDTIESMGRLLMVTKQDRLVLAPSRAVRGDKIVVLYGCSIPMLLRRKVAAEDGGGKKKYEVIGECYLDGFVNGEAVEMVKRKELAEETFLIV